MPTIRQEVPFPSYEVYTHSSYDCHTFLQVACTRKLNGGNPASAKMVETFGFPLETEMNKYLAGAVVTLCLMMSAMSYGRADDNTPPAKSGETVGQSAASAGRAVKDTAVDIGHGAKDAAVGVGHAVKDAAVEVGTFAKDNAVKAGHAVRDAAKEVGQAVKPGKSQAAPVQDGTRRQ